MAALTAEQKEQFESEIGDCCRQITQIRASNLGADLKAKKIQEIEDKIAAIKKEYGVSRRHIEIKVRQDGGAPVKEVQHIMDGDPLAK